MAVCLLAWVTAVPASSESIRTRAVPALYRTAGGLKQEVQVIIEHQGVSTQATVNFNGQVKNIRLSEGENICSFELDEIKMNNRYRCLFHMPVIRISLLLQ